MAATGLLGHDDVDALVMRLRLSTEASELHGSLCGYLAGGGVLTAGTVLGALQLDGDVAAPSTEDLALLDRLADQSKSELVDSELAFEPLLPEDDRPLAERAGAMVDWCRGFLGGFGLAGAPAHAKLSDEAQEILHDLGAVASSSFDLGEESEDEDALIDVHEFVRMAAMLLFAECNTRAASLRGTVH